MTTSYSDEWAAVPSVAVNFRTINEKFTLNQLVCPNFDLEKARSQVRETLKLNSPVHCSLDEKGDKFTHPHWAGLALRNYSPRSTDYFCKGSIRAALEDPDDWQKEARKALQDNKLIFLDDLSIYDTEISEPLGYLRDYVNQNLCRKTFRVYLLFIKKQGFVDWHKHAYPPETGYHSKYIVHIPIFTNPESRFFVRKPNGDKEEIHMAAGEIWTFNHYLEHKAVNLNSTEDRIHLVVYCDPRDELFKKRLFESEVAGHFTTST